VQLQKLALFAAAPEQETIAALEPDNVPAAPRVFHQQFVHLFLWEGVPGIFLAGIDPHGVFRNQRENIRADQPVINHNIRLPERFRARNRQQPAPARASANQRYHASPSFAWHNS
jgi:hypothetical protein